MTEEPKSIGESQKAVDYTTKKLEQSERREPIPEAQKEYTTQPLYDLKNKLVGIIDERDILDPEPVIAEELLNMLQHEGITSSAIQMLFLFTNEDPLTGTPLTNIEEKVQAAKKYLEVKRNDPQLHDRMTTPESEAANILFEKKHDYNEKHGYSLRDYIKSYFKLRTGLTDHQFELYTATHPLETTIDIDNALSWYKASLEFVKSDIFTQPAKEPSPWVFKEGRMVELPDNEGQRKAYQLHDHPYDPSQVRVQLADGSQFDLPQGYVDQFNTHTFEEKALTISQAIAESTAAAVEEVKRYAVMVGTLGELHPWIVNGKYRWVLRPSGKFLGAALDQEQYELSERSLIAYTEKMIKMKEAGAKVIDLEHSGSENPAVYIQGTTIHPHNRHRILAAQAARMPIVVRITDYRSEDSPLIPPQPKS